MLPLQALMIRVLQTQLNNTIHLPTMGIDVGTQTTCNTSIMTDVEQIRKPEFSAITTGSWTTPTQAGRFGSSFKFDPKPKLASLAMSPAAPRTPAARSTIVNQRLAPKPKPKIAHLDSYISFCDKRLAAWLDTLDVAEKSPTTSE